MGRLTGMQLDRAVFKEVLRDSISEHLNVTCSAAKTELILLDLEYEVDGFVDIFEEMDEETEEENDESDL